VLAELIKVWLHQSQLTLTIS